MRSSPSRIIALTFLLTCYWPLGARTAEEQAPGMETNAPEVWLTIFIHGIIQPPKADLYTFSALLRDCIEDTLYERAVWHLRRDPILYKNQAMQEPGLVPINHLTPEAINAADLLARIYDDVTTNVLGRPVENHFYTFGWSGLLSERGRYCTAQEFYCAIVKLLRSFHERGIYPKLRVVSYSHGGNITLNLAAIHDCQDIPEDCRDIPFSIDEFFSLGMPVQRKTDFLVGHPLFKKIFHFYSNDDTIQRMDLAVSKQFYSDRNYASRSQFQIPDKLTRGRIRVTKRVYRRNRRQRMDPVFPKAEDLLDPMYRRYHIDPGHIELWCFGWITSRYREEFSLHPLPIVAFLPLIADAIEKEGFSGENITIDICPDQNALVITDSPDKGNSYVAPLPTNVIARMMDEAHIFQPYGGSKEEYDRCRRRALQRAHADKAAEYAASFRKRRKGRGSTRQQQTIEGASLMESAPA